MMHDRRESETQVSRGALLWSAPQPSKSGMTRFREWVQLREQTELPDYAAFHSWSIEHLDRFWQALWDYFEIASDTPYSAVRKGEDMFSTEWFVGSQVNLGEHILRGLSTDPEALAVVVGDESGGCRKVSRGELLEDVRAFAGYLVSRGIGQNDRIFGFLNNGLEALVAVLASWSIGALWAGVSPEFGETATAARCDEYQPTVVVATDGYRFGGRFFDRRDAVASLLRSCPSARLFVHVPSVEWNGTALDGDDAQRVSFAEALREGAGREWSFASVPFRHPAYVGFSSGTTGKPKGIVHGHGGLTLEMFKMGLHFGSEPGTILTMVTTTGWMVWPMMVTQLGAGAAIGLYDGNPLHRESDALGEFVCESGTTNLLVSSAFHSIMRDREIVPNDRFDLSAVRVVGFGASPASPEAMEWAAATIADRPLVNTASGGTDIFTCFVGGCPDVPSRAGEFQCTWLATDARAFDEHGREVSEGSPGELVIAQPMPSMPVAFLNDPDRARLYAAYFEANPGYWTHGDLFVRLPDGMSRIIGRSDATLNRGGVRIGTAEIYEVLEQVPEIVDSLVVDLTREDGSSEMVLFAQLRESAALDGGVEYRIRACLKSGASPRHVPERIAVVDEVPYTITGKKLEVAIKRLLTGTVSPEAFDRSTARNPSAFDAFIDYGAEHGMLASNAPQISNEGTTK